LLCTSPLRLSALKRASSYWPLDPAILLASIHALFPRFSRISRVCFCVLSWIFFLEGNRNPSRRTSRPLAQFWQNPSWHMSTRATSVPHLVHLGKCVPYKLYQHCCLLGYLPLGGESSPRCKFVFSFGHELLLRHCEVCTALFATIVDHMLALEFDQLDESRMLTVHRR
jgi:hypothetical protein